MTDERREQDTRLEQEIHRLEKKLERIAEKISVSQRRTSTLEQLFAITAYKALKYHALLGIT